MTDIQKLKALAQKQINPANWFKPGEKVEGLESEDLEFIAAANPALVLELITEVERLKASNIDQGKQIQWLGEYNTQRHVELSSENVQVIRQRLDAEKERDQLKTENTDLHATLQAAKGEIERLKGESETLLTALKGMASMYGYCWDLVDGGLFCMQDNVQRFEGAHEEAQKAIAAMSKEAQS